jgi:hypothetical protein
MNLEYAPMAQQDWDWFLEKLPVFIVSDSSGVLVTSNGKRVAAWVFDNYTGAGGSVQCHMVVEKTMVLKYGLIEMIASMAFDTLECSSICASVPSDKPEALKLDKHIGFEEMCILKDALGTGVHSHIMRMTPENCNYYQTEQRAA